MSHANNEVSTGFVRVLPASATSESPLFLQAAAQYRDGEYLDYIAQNKTKESIVGFSRVRENVLSWYPFAQSSRILEIGSGMGAVTGLFVRQAKRVVALERQYDYAHTCATRFSEYGNLEVYHGNPETGDYRQFGSFDYVVIHSDVVLTQVLLKRIKEVLHSNGRVLMLVCNKLSYREITDARLDTVGPFDMYARLPEQAFYSKSQIQMLVEQSGFRGVRFYYPYPDHMFTRYVFSDVRLPKAEELLTHADYECVARCRVLHEEAFLQSCSEEGCFPVLSASFLVELAIDALQDDFVAYAKISNERRRDYSIITTIDSTSSVHKAAIYPEGSAHLSTMLWAQNTLKDCYQTNFSLNMLTPDSNGLAVEYLEGTTLEEMVIGHMRAGHKQEALNLLDELLNRLEHAKCVPFEITEEFLQVFGEQSDPESFSRYKGTPSQTVTNIDSLLRNVIISDESWCLVDYEWTFAFPIPLPYIRWRILFYLLFNKYAQQKEEEYDFWNRWGIDEDDRRVFYEMEVSFQQYLTGDSESIDAVLSNNTPQPCTLLELMLGKAEDVSSELHADKHGLSSIVSKLFRRN